MYRKTRQYLHLWNNLPQNVVQTSSPLWQAQRPEDNTNTGRGKNKKNSMKPSVQISINPSHHWLDSHYTSWVFKIQWGFFSPSDNFFLFYSVFGGSLSTFWLYINSLMQRKFLTIQAVLQISAGVLYPEPISTSRDRYCRVWMSSVKCLCWEEKRQIRKQQRISCRFHHV